MNKYHFIFDKNKKTHLLKKKLKNFKKYSIKKCNIIVVAGGDGFMLKNLKKFYNFQKPFYGINCGTVGFLMNKNHKISLLKRKIEKAKKFSINPIEVKITNTKKKTFKMIAVNEISLLRQSKQTANLLIKINKKNLIKELVSDGVLVSTPAGSTAYNLSVNGPILSLDSKKIALTPISPFRPRRWKGKLVSDKSKINIINLQSKKRPISAVADNNEIRNIQKIEIKVNQKIKISLLFDRRSSLIKKIKEEQKKIK
tara:strand:- start:15955 stop:16719 length:765 start_codon:yes stop_codon:yes gene_type:complete